MSWWLATKFFNFNHWIDKMRSEAPQLRTPWGPWPAKIVVNLAPAPPPGKFPAYSLILCVSTVWTEGNASCHPQTSCVWALFTRSMSSAYVYYYNQINIRLFRWTSSFWSKSLLSTSAKKSVYNWGLFVCVLCLWLWSVLWKPTQVILHIT